MKKTKAQRILIRRVMDMRRGNYTRQRTKFFTYLRHIGKLDQYIMLNRAHRRGEKIETRKIVSKFGKLQITKMDGSEDKQLKRSLKELIINFLKHAEEFLRHLWRRDKSDKFASGNLSEA